MNYQERVGSGTTLTIGGRGHISLSGDTRMAEMRKCERDAMAAQLAIASEQLSEKVAAGKAVPAPRR